MKQELIDRVNNIYWQYDTKKQIVKKPKDLAVLTSITSFGKYTKNGPIGVVECLFNKEKVNLIVLGGTQFKEGQATRLKESRLSMKGKDNDYMFALINVIKKLDKNIPLILTGISLGGMIAQQLLNYDAIKDYTIKSIICFGSPLVKPLNRKNIRIIRFCDKMDIVPKLGQLKFKLFDKKTMKDLNNKEQIIGDGKYKTRLEAHTLGYVENTFDKYDFYGELNGKNELELLDEIKFYEAPVGGKSVKR